MNDTDKLLHKAHLIINDATGTDIPQAKEKARRIYNQIKTINPDVYERIKIDLKK